MDNEGVTCSGHCAVQLMNDLIASTGKNETLNLLELNFNNFLFSMSNATLLRHFCQEFHKFEYCCSTCTLSYSREIMMGCSEIINHICVHNFNDIKEHFGCLARLDPQIRQICMKTCTSHQNALHSIIRNFRHFILNSDVSMLENYLNESCEYVVCSLHCDIPLIVHKCGYEIAQKVITLTSRSFKSMEKMALNTAAVERWPKACTEVIKYKLPIRNSLHEQKGYNASNVIVFQKSEQVESNAQITQILTPMLISVIYSIMQSTGKS